MTTIISRQLEECLEIIGAVGFMKVNPDKSIAVVEAGLPISEMNYEQYVALYKIILICRKIVARDLLNFEPKVDK